MSLRVARHVLHRRRLHFPRLGILDICILNALFYTSNNNNNNKRVAPKFSLKHLSRIASCLGRTTIKKQNKKSNSNHHLHSAIVSQIYSRVISINHELTGATNKQHANLSQLFYILEQRNTQSHLLSLNAMDRYFFFFGGILLQHPPAPCSNIIILSHILPAFFFNKLSGKDLTFPICSDFFFLFHLSFNEVWRMK